MSSFREAVTIKRQTGTYTDGVWVPGGEVDVAILASIQPARSRDMQNLPEGRRTKSAFVLYTDTELLTSKDGSNIKKADQLTIVGDVFEVMFVERWQNRVIPHYKATVAKIE